ncbi:MAG: hypothetical protein NC923_07070, partial [Candidatus Omnitrophica bacterium]|nr:hypothetical protein [Candidatus Omnitrophota bacterium]
MSNRDKISLYSDRAITIFLSLLIFCLPFSKAMVEIFVWIATFIFILKKIIMRSYYPLRRMLPETELNMSLTLFIAVNALSLIFTSDYRLSLRGFFGKEIKFLAIYFMLVETINSNKRLKVVLIAIIASSILITVDAAAQYFRGLDFIRHYP